MRSRRAATAAFEFSRWKVGDGLRGLAQQAELGARAGSRQAPVPLLGELLATAEEVQVRQREGVGQVLVALAFQKPQQQGRQIGPHAPGRAGLAQQILQLAADLAAGDLAAQQGVVAVEQLVADRREEVEMAQQIGDAALSAAGDRPATGRTQVAHDGQRIAEGSQGALDGRAHLARVLRTHAHRVEHPAVPAGQAQERAAPALVAGGIDVQGVAVGHGRAQGGGALPVQGLQGRQEAITECGDGTGGEDEALTRQGGADLLALEMLVIAGQPDPHDQVVAVALAGRGQAGQLPGEGDRAVLAGAAVLADFAGHHCASGEREQPAGLALLAAQGLAAVWAVALLGDEIDVRRSSADAGGASDSGTGPAGLAGLFEQQGQRPPEPPFSTSSASSKRSKTACTWTSRMGGEWPCRRRATWAGGDPGWRTRTSRTSMMSRGSREAARRAAMRAWRACSWRSPSGPGEK